MYSASNVVILFWTSCKNQFFPIFRAKSLWFGKLKTIEVQNLSSYISRSGSGKPQFWTVSCRQDHVIVWS